MLIFHFKIHAKSVEDNEIELNAGAVCAATIKKREEKSSREFSMKFLCVHKEQKKARHHHLFFVTTRVSG